MEKTKQTVEAPNSSYGMKHVDYWNLTAFEAVAMSVVGVLAVTLGVLISASVVA